MAGATGFPFPPKAPAAKAEAVAAPAVDTAEAPAPVAKTAKVKKTTKNGEDRKTPNKQMTKDQVGQVLALVATTSYTDIGEQLGITKFQVNRVLMETKKTLREAAAADPAKLAKVEAYIAEVLSRPEDTRPGSKGPKGGKVKSSIGDIVGSILAGL